MHFCHRTKVLETQGLTLESFETREAAWKAADTLIELCHKENPEEVLSHPNRIIGITQLDQFWFSCAKGRQWDSIRSCFVLCTSLVRSPCIVVAVALTRCAEGMTISL